MPHRLKSNIRFLDKSFQENQAQLYVLSLMYDKSGLAFTLFYPKQNKFIGFFNYPFEKSDEGDSPDLLLEKVISEHKWLGLKFLEVNFLVANSYSTLVPLPLFDENKTAAYLKFNQEEPGNSEIKFDTLKNTLAANIYFCPDGLTSRVNEIWPNSRMVHSGSALLEILAINFKNITKEKQVFVNVSENRFELVYFKQSKLHFYNTFNYKTKEDFIYFLLAAFEQLSINPEEAALSLLGTINKEGRLYEIIYQYIRHTDFIERNENFNYSHVLDEILPHYYYVLFNVLQCG